jgi:hypothetical protein
MTPKTPKSPPKSKPTAKGEAKPKAGKGATAPKTKPAPKPRGRPSVYTPEVARKICLQIAEGKSLREICRNEDMPADATVREWVVDDRDGFSAQYTRAIQARAVLWAEEITGIADDGSNDTYIDPNTGQEKTNAEVVARSRLRVDTRKWMLSKVLPKVYGDKLDLNHGVQPENPLASLVQRIAGSGLPVIKDEAGE